MGLYGSQMREEKGQSMQKIPGAGMQAWLAQGAGRKTQEILQGDSTCVPVVSRPVVSPRIRPVHTAFAVLISGRGDPAGPAAREEVSSVLWIHVEFTQSELHASKDRLLNSKYLFLYTQIIVVLLSQKETYLCNR